MLGWALTAVLAASCDATNRAKAPGYAGDERTSGGEDQKLADNTDIDDDGLVRGLFLELRDAERIRTCAPDGAPWVIIAYAPEVIDAHSVRRRRIARLVRRTGTEQRGRERGRHESAGHRRPPSCATNIVPQRAPGLRARESCRSVRA